MGDLFFEICRNKTHIFCDAKESHNVGELKKIIEGISKVSPKDQQLYKVKDGRVTTEVLEDRMTLAEAGFTSSTARAQQPAVIAMAFRKPDGAFEQCVVDPVTEPPPLPDVMRTGQTETAGSSQKHEEQAI